MKDKIEVRKSIIEGKGIFASKCIKEGQVICRMKGKKISVKNLKTKYTSGKERIDDPFQIADRVYIILQKPYVYFNHSCDPNAGIIKTTTLVAIKSIEPGEEITYDYSTTEWSDDEYWGINWQKIWKISCNYGSGICRGTIREFPMLPLEIKSKYYKIGILPSFIIKKLK